MAIYYVRPDGNNSNTGTGPAANQAWQTLARITQGGTAFTSGDTVFIAPGTYRQSLYTSVYTSPTYFTGDPTASQFPGVTPGIVRITNFLVNDNSAATSQLLWGGTTFDYINISNIYFDHSSIQGGIYYTGTGTNSSIKNCIFSGNGAAGGGLGSPAIRLTSIKNITIENCIIMRSYVGMYLATTTDTDTNILIRNCFVNNGNTAIWINNSTGGGIKITNTVISGTSGSAVYIQGTGNSTSLCYFTNSIIYQCTSTLNGGSSTNIIENYNRRVGSGGNVTVPNGASTVTDGAPQFDFGHSSLFGLAIQKPFSSITGSVNVGAGLSTYASTTDLYGQTWSAGASLPDIGCATAVQASGTSYYYPTERNTSSVTISPNATSKTLHLYLGATGLLFNTSGLSARYTRSGSNSVAISLVSQTSNGAWVSGGFAEIDAINQPGLYRLDVPNAAFVSGVDRVTITVRGASGTNGAVVDCQLISSQLDLTQAVPTSNTANTIGDCLNAARAQGFGKWAVTGTTLRLYAPDGTTVVRTFTLDSETSPSQRV